MVKRRMDISLNQLFSSLSIALDLAQNRSYEHARRTAYVSLRLAERMNLVEKDRADIYFAALLHDIGMAGQLAKYNIDEFHHRNDLRKLHADNGYALARKLPLEHNIADAILYHHDHWDGTGVHGMIRGREIPLAAQIIHVADDFDVIFNGVDISLERRKNILEVMREGKGKYFHPEVTDHLISLGQTEKFWMDLRSRHIQMVLNGLEPIETTSINIEDLEKIAEVFAYIIDNKSEFTYTHSQGISDISKKMAKFMGYEELKYRKIGIAAYLHDLGKLAVPNEILDKPESLTDVEFLNIQSHSYYTKLILGQVEGCEDIARWAGNHHEKLDGAGYPERLSENQITEEDQIIAFADIYQALTEHRPYRNGLSKDEALKIIHKLVQGKKMMKSVFDCLEAVV